LVGNNRNNICFTSANFDRQALRRSDDDWIAQQLADANSRFLPFWQNKFLVTESCSLIFFNKSDAEFLSLAPLAWKYMGEMVVDKAVDNTPVSIFGAEITELPEQAEINEQVEQKNWQILRKIGARLPAEQANLSVYAQGLFNWHAINKFCSHCGDGLIEQQAGHGLSCSSQDCTNEVFPRTDPAVMVLVYHKDACLLARASHWPEKMYSCLAGFVETGEDLEAAVKREIYEESGVVLTDTSYRGSQPWPFPQSLMLGFHAEANSRELTFHDGEIEDGRWYSRQQLLDAVSNEKLRLPSSLSISFTLIEDWFNQQSEKPLTQLLNR